MNKLWFVKHPIARYNEDVKALAKKNNLSIVDDKFKDDCDPAKVADKTPELTVIGEKKSKKKTKKPAVKIDSE